MYIKNPDKDWLTFRGFLGGVDVQHNEFWCSMLDITSSAALGLCVTGILK